MPPPEENYPIAQAAKAFWVEEQLNISQKLMSLGLVPFEGFTIIRPFDALVGRLILMYLLDPSFNFSHIIPLSA